MNEYLISLSSFYKAAYGQEILTEAGIRTVLKRTPPNLVGSCGYALAVQTDLIHEVLQKLQRKNVMPVRTFWWKKKTERLSIYRLNNLNTEVQKRRQKKPEYMKKRSQEASCHAKLTGNWNRSLVQ